MRTNQWKVVDKIKKRLKAADEDRGRSLLDPWEVAMMHAELSKLPADLVDGYGKGKNYKNRSHHENFAAVNAGRALAKAAMDGTAAEAREFHCNCLEHDAKEEVAAAIVCLGANNPANIAALAKAGAGEMLAAIIASVEGRGPAKRAEK